jgi:hypothetical protein
MHLILVSYIQASGGLGLDCACCFHFGLSFAMAIYPSNSSETPLLASAFTPASYPTSSMGNQPAENLLTNLSIIAVAPGSWAYEQRGQPNEKSDWGSNCQCREGVQRRKRLTEVIWWRKVRWKFARHIERAHQLCKLRRRLNTSSRKDHASQSFSLLGKTRAL